MISSFRELSLAMGVVSVLIALVACRSTPSPTSSPIQTPTGSSVSPLAPDGRSAGIRGRLMFHSNSHGSFDIYVMSLDTGDVSLLIGGPGNDIEPDWSSDGRQVVFSSQRGQSDSLDIYVLDVEGGEVQFLTGTPGALDWSPVWSSDGAKIAYVSNAPGNLDIFMFDVQTGDTVNLTEDSANDYSPAWSSDGNQIAFISDRHNGNAELYVMDVGSRELVRLTDSVEEESRPCWSPDGKEIMVASEVADMRILQRISLEDPETYMPVSGPPIGSTEPEWTPDYLFFAVGEAGSQQLFVQDLYSSSVLTLTADTAVNGFARWAP